MKLYFCDLTKNLFIFDAFSVFEEIIWWRLLRGIWISWTIISNEQAPIHAYYLPLELLLRMKIIKNLILILTKLNLRRPLRKKCGWGGFSTFPRWRSRVFLNWTSLTPSDFWCASFWNYRFKPFQISFFSGFNIRIMFRVRWFYSLFERMRLKSVDILYLL